jgi:hypothetical protein
MADAGDTHAGTQAHTNAGFRQLTTNRAKKPECKIDAETTESR